MTPGAGAWTPPGLYLFPCNGNAIDALDCIDARQFRCIGYIDDDPSKQAVAECHGHRLVGREALTGDRAARVLAVPGNPRNFGQRASIIASLDLPPARFATVIHPGAHVSSRAMIGCNVLIMAGVVVTSDAVIGSHVILMPNAVVHHGVRIGDHALVGSNVTLAGSVELGANCYIASGTSIKDGVRIGAGAMVGIGSTVLHDVDAAAVVAGNPARRLR